MKQTIRKTLSFVLTVTMILSLCVFSAGAEENNLGKVRVTVRNDTFSVSQGAKWDGVLIDEWIDLCETDSAESVIENLLRVKGYNFEVSVYGYISSVNGLGEFDNAGYGGWMITLNDWFTADSASAYKVSNGELQNGDEIVMHYTNDWGYDCGSLYGVLDTTLKSLRVSNGSLSKPFVDSNHEYILSIDDTEAEIRLLPEAYNKNYQVRTYLNEYQPEIKNVEIKRSQSVKVADGETIYIGVGNPLWPSMNSYAGIADETVYTVKVICAKEHEYKQGDVDLDSDLNIDDVTIIQRHLAEYEMFDVNRALIADVDGDGKVTIFDVTTLQRILAEYE